jgi:hypothetical protein
MMPLVQHVRASTYLALAAGTLPRTASAGHSVTGPEVQRITASLSNMLCVAEGSWWQRWTHHQ